MGRLFLKQPKHNWLIVVCWFAALFAWGAWVVTVTLIRLNEESREPDLDYWIEKLESPSVYDRKQARRHIPAFGKQAVPKLMEVWRKAPEALEPQYCLEEIGLDAMPALVNELKKRWRK